MNTTVPIPGVSYPNDPTFEPYMSAVSSGDGDYSPLIFNNFFSKSVRLLISLIFAITGSILNGFFVSSFFVEPTLRTKGNIFLACCGFCDLIITGGVLPIAFVVLLSGQWDTLPVCHMAQVAVEISAYSYNIFFALLALENYYRTCHCTRVYQAFLAMRIEYIALLVFIVITVTSIVGVNMGLDFDYCKSKGKNSMLFRLTTAFFFYAIPTVIAFSLLIVSSIVVCTRARLQARHRRSQEYTHILTITNANLAAYVLFVFGWLPFLYVIYLAPNASNYTFYYAVSFGIARSVLSVFVFSFSVPKFRETFAHLFNYCFCKNSLPRSHCGRQCRDLERSSINTHIMQRALISPPAAKTLLFVNHISK